MSFGMMVTRVGGAQVSVFEQPNEIGLGDLLVRQHGRALEVQVGLEVLEISRTRRWKGSLQMRSSVYFW